MQSLAIPKISKDSGRSAAGVVVLVLLAAASHLAYLGTPPVNLEFSFIDAAKYFSTGNPQDLAQYFYYEANTLAIPWIAAAIHWLIPGLGIEYIPRLLAVASVPFLAIGLLRINRQLGKPVTPYLLLSVVLFNPLEWTFAGRGTVDALPAALAIFALSLFWNEHEQDNVSLPRRLLASAVFGIVAVIKYHGLLLLVGIIVETAVRRRTAYAKILLEWMTSTAPAVLILGVYVLFIRIKFGFWFAPPEFQRLHSPELTESINNLLSYAGFLILLTIPFSLILSWPRLVRSQAKLAAAAGVAVVAFLFGYFLLPDNLEINLGPLDHYIGKHLLNGALAMLSGLLALHLTSGAERRGLPAAVWARKIGLEVAIIAFIVILSFSRPSQRYLIFIIPLFYFFLLPPRKYPRAMWAGAILISIALDVYIVLNQIATGVAASEMADRIAALGLMRETFAPPILESHVGDRFYPYRNDGKAYEVVPYDASNKIAEVHYSVFPRIPFIGKTYSLIPLQQPDR